MINELMKVAGAMQALPRVSEGIPEVLQPLPKASASAPCIRVWLTSDGQIDRLEKLTIEHAAQLRKFAPNKFSSLPGFNITFIRGMEDAASRRELKKTLEGLERNFTTAREAIEKACGNKLDEDETLAILLAAVKRMDAIRFQEIFDDKIQNDNLGWQATPGKKISVFLDVKEYKDFPVAHARTLERLNALLYAADLTPAPAESEGTKDAYDGDAAGADVLFSDVSLPRLLGQIKIRSLNKNVPAQRRYHLVGSATFPVGKASRERTESALKWISALENEGTTFGVAGDSELLFAYPAELPPDSLPQLATLLGAQRKDVLAEQKFKALAESVIAQLKGTGTAAKDGNLEIFSLRKMDNARTKVVYYRNTTVPSLEAASRAWDAGFKNIPPLSLCDESVTVFPIRLSYILNSIWKTDGMQIPYRDKKTQKPRVSHFKPTDGLRLLLEDNAADLASEMLLRFNQHSFGLFLNLCRCTTRYKAIAERNKESAAKRKIIETVLAKRDTYPGVLGLLLYKLGKTKENYMNESAFQLGRFLRVADEIHRLYCEVVRTKDGKPDIPPELCGSSMLIAMQENPAMTMDQLTQRAAPYVKWANAYSDNQKVLKRGEKEIKAIALVKTWWHRWAEISDQLHTQDWSQRLDHAQRAQIFIGYLSSFPKSDNTPASTQTEGTQQ
jgi:hypothetical protein